MAGVSLLPAPRNPPAAATSIDLRADLAAMFGQRVSITVSGRAALRRMLEHLRLPAHREVAILTTTGATGLWVSPCVTTTIADFCQFAPTLSERTAAVLVIHEWGIPYPRLDEVRAYCQHHGLPLIEDGAHAFASVDAQGQRVGTTGDFALFSLPKFFPMAQGGLLLGLGGDDSGSTGEIAGELTGWLAHTPAIAQQRVANWQQLNAAVAQLGLHSVVPLAPGAVPLLYALATPRQFATARALRQAGIESGPDAYSGSVLLPCHQDVTAADVQRIVAAVREGSVEREAAWRT